MLKYLLDGAKNLSPGIHKRDWALQYCMSFKSSLPPIIIFLLKGTLHNLCTKNSSVYVKQSNGILSGARFFERFYNFNGMIVGCNIPLADFWIL